MDLYETREGIVWGFTWVDTVECRYWSDLSDALNRMYHETSSED